VNVKLGLAARHQQYCERRDDDREGRRDPHDPDEAPLDRSRGKGVGYRHALSFGAGS
jgi:hypothetical protein